MQLCTYDGKSSAILVHRTIVVGPSGFSLAIERAAAGDREPIDVSEVDPAAAIARTSWRLDDSPEVEADRPPAWALEHCRTHQERPSRDHYLTMAIVLTSSVECTQERLKRIQTYSSFGVIRCYGKRSR